MKKILAVIALVGGAVLTVGAIAILKDVKQYNAYCKDNKRYWQYADEV